MRERERDRQTDRQTGICDLVRVLPDTEVAHDTVLLEDGADVRGVDGGLTRLGEQLVRDAARVVRAVPPTDVNQQVLQSLEPWFKIMLLFTGRKLVDSSIQLVMKSPEFDQENDKPQIHQGGVHCPKPAPISTRDNSYRIAMLTCDRNRTMVLPRRTCRGSQRGSRR